MILMGWPRGSVQNLKLQKDELKIYRQRMFNNLVKI